MKKYVYTYIPGLTPPLREIGVAFVNADGSLQVELDSFPVSGRLHIRDERLAREPAPAGGDQ